MQKVELPEIIKLSKTYNNFLHILPQNEIQHLYTCISISSYGIHPQMSITCRVSPQHEIKDKDKNKADSKRGIKVHSFSVLYRRNESEDKNSSGQFIVWCGAWSCQDLSGWWRGPEVYSTEQLPRGKMSIYSSQSEHRFVKGMTYEGSGTATYPCTIL